MESNQLAKNELDISALDKAEVLAALYNNSKPLGLGYLHYDPSEMSREEAAELLTEYKCFDYLKGRVMKVNLEGGILRTCGYDLDNGSDAARTVIDSLLQKAFQPEEVQQQRELSCR